jgi:hypothetical protein
MAQRQDDWDQHMWAMQKKLRRTSIFNVYILNRVSRLFLLLKAAIIIQHWFFKIRGDLAESQKMSLVKKRLDKGDRLKVIERVSINSKKVQSYRKMS